MVVGSGSGFEASIRRRVTGVLSDPDRRSTKLLLATISTRCANYRGDQAGVYVLRSQASPFGHNAPCSRSIVAACFKAHSVSGRWMPMRR